jgi:competence transcription factor ComK
MHFEFGFLGKQNILAIVVHIAITPPLSLSLSLSIYIYIYEETSPNKPQKVWLSWWS